MKDTHFTRQERDIILWLRFLTGAFVICGLIFLIHPNYFLQYLDDIGMVFFNFRSLPLENPKYEMWWVLTLALMGFLTYASFQAQTNWLRYHNLIPPVIIAKGISTLGFLSLTIFHPTHFFYIVALLVDGIICLTTWYAYAQAIKSRTF